MRLVSQTRFDELSQRRRHVVPGERRPFALSKLEHDLSGGGAEGVHDGGVQHLPARHAEGEDVAEGGYRGAVEVLL